jgi:hypothetical protein
VVTNIDLELVGGYRDQHRYEANFKKNMVEPVINENDYSHTLENIKEYLASQYGGTGATLDYVSKLKLWSNLKLMILRSTTTRWIKR